MNAKKFLSTTCVSLVLLSCISCTYHSKKVEQDVDEEEVELAGYMGELQRFSQKLGFAIHGKNQKLSDFYLHEIEEVLGELKEIKEHEGMPIADSVQVIMTPLVSELSQYIHASNWKKSSKSYLEVIEGCNRCHSATEHEFIKILPSRGKSPFNQDFT